MTDRGFFRATKRSAQFPRTPRRTVPTGFGRGARFAIRLRLVERTSFDARVYNQTSSLLKTLFVSRSWVLGERHIAKALSNDVVRRRTEVACLWGSAARHCRRIARGKKACPHQPLGHGRRRGPYGAPRQPHRPRRHMRQYCARNAGVGASRQCGLVSQAYRPLAQKKKGPGGRFRSQRALEAISSQFWVLTCPRRTHQANASS